MTKHYVEFIYGGMFSDTGAPQEIDHRDSSKITIPDGACGFRFYDREVSISNGEELRGNIKNPTGWFYKGTKCNLNEVKNMNTNGRYDILISNMECNHWDYVCMFDGGYVYPLNKNDVVL
jgi:hypothetical protein